MRLPTARSPHLATALLLGAIASAAAAGDLAAQSFTLTFDGISPAGNGADVGATFGSIAGLSITNRGRNDFGAGTVNGGLCRWTTQYGDLVNVAYTCNQSAGVGELTFTPQAGFQVTLHGFDVGEYQGRIAGSAEVRVYDLAFTAPPLFQATQALGAASHWSLSPELTTTAGFNLQWGDNWDYGIDNISITVAPVAGAVVPEPATVALVGGGLAALGAVTRRRRRAGRVGGR